MMFVPGKCIKNVVSLFTLVVLSSFCFAQEIVPEDNETVPVYPVESE